MGEIVRTETLYTYEAAIAEYEHQKYYDWLCRERRMRSIRVEEKARREYFLNQKLLGGMWSILVIFLTVIIGNLVCAVLIIPALALLFSKEMIIVNDYWWTHRHDAI